MSFQEELKKDFMEFKEKIKDKLKAVCKSDEA